METGLGGGLVPIHRRVHDAVIGDRQMMHTELFGLGDVIVDPAHAIEQ